MLPSLDFVMKKIHYNKLIRDKIPAKMDKKGARYSVKKLGSKQFEQELMKKVGEESDGLISTKTKVELIDELSDIIAVIEEIKKFKKINHRQMSAALKKNMDKKGGFKKRLFLYWSEDTGYKTNERTYKK
jgi:predicted house-cleaning noncanonical NTP pyrophosphatase (MazG superfamily)